MSYIFPKAQDVRKLSDKSISALVERARTNRLMTSVKYDGCALIIRCGSGPESTYALSGDGHEVRSAQHIIVDLWSSYSPNIIAGATLVGEAWSEGTPFPDLSGEFRRHKPGAYSFIVFDVCPPEGPNIPYSLRRNTILAYHTKPEFIKWTTDICLATQDLVDIIEGRGAGMRTAPGCDGLVLHDRDAYWVEGRSKTAVVKVKPVLTLDLLVTGTLQGKGKHAGRIGSLVCEGSFGTVNVGTGLSDAERERTDWVGKVVEVSCMSLHPSGIPREPRFVRERPDKGTSQTD